MEPSTSSISTTNRIKTTKIAMTGADHQFDDATPRSSESYPSSPRRTSSSSCSRTASSSSSSRFSSAPFSLFSSLSNTMRTTLTTTLFLAFLGVGLGGNWFIKGAEAAAKAEPGNNQVYFGAWIDTSAQQGDSAASFNKRLGLNTPVFQISQLIPLPPFDYVTGAGGEAPEAMIEASGTDAAVFITVYPNANGGLAAVQQNDLDDLAEQISRYQAKNRTVFLRYGPEMQGNWNKYGVQPTDYVAQWKTMYTTMQQKAPGTIVVWAPNTGSGYPFGAQLDDVSPADAQVLDTNGDGQLSGDDDPFQPYFPGADFVDWIGMSIYFKGTQGGEDTQNDGVPEQGFCSSELQIPVQNVPGATGDTFYDRYCTLPDKACMIAESGGAYHSDNPTGTSELDIKTGWIDTCIANATMFTALDRLKLIMNFEQTKNESITGGSDTRDYRLTNNTQVLQALQSAFNAMPAQFTWANPRAIPTSLPPGQGPTTDASGSTLSSVPDVISATIRARPSGPPSLFGNKHVGAAFIREAVELAVVVGCGIVGVGVVMKWL